MKKEIKARQDGGWRRVEWELPEAPILRDLEVVHGRLVYLNPKVRKIQNITSKKNPLKFIIIFSKTSVPHPLLGAHSHVLSYSSTFSKYLLLFQLPIEPIA